MINVSILGYGRIGKEVEKELKFDSSINLRFIFDNSNDLLKNIDNLNSEDFIIDFSTAEAFLKNLPILLRNKVNIICGTTGWYEKIELVKDLVLKNDSSFLYGANFSIGVHFFWKLIEQATKYSNRIENMDIFMNEIHHNKKIDAPSGTSITTANKIFENSNIKEKIYNPYLNKAIEKKELSLGIIRGGEVFGEHSVFFEDEDSNIEIKHTSKNRSCFAKGTILGVKWLQDTHKRGFFSVDDMIADIL